VGRDLATRLLVPSARVQCAGEPFGILGGAGSHRAGRGPFEQTESAAGSTARRRPRSGVGIGLVSALLLGRLVASLIYGVRATDAATLASVSLLLIVVGLAASVLPAYRAARVDPLRSPRDE